VNTDITRLKKRSNRYSIRAPLRYRIRGERTWHHGLSTNISDSGILFESETPFSPGEQCEILMNLRVQSEQARETSVRFRATAVRCPNDRECAAQISNRRLQRHRVASGQ
jgi:hypothetical protein